MFFVAFMVAVITIDLPPSHGAPVGLLIVAWMLMTAINIVPLVRYFIQGDASSSKPKENFPSHLAQNLLPPQNVPVNGFARQRVSTADLRQPLTITEHTTNLLGGE